MYNKFTKNNIKVDFNRSGGNWVYDLNTDRLYLDLHNSYSSMPLGYLKLESSDILMKNLSICEYSSPLHDALFEHFESKMLTEKYDAYHLAPSGGVAVEMALKVAMQATGRDKILALQNSFHGVTGMSALATSTHFGERVQFLNRQKTEHIFSNGTYEQIEQGIKHHAYDWNDDVELINNTACIIVEPIQCSYGDNHIEWQFLKDLREIARKHGIPFIVDEIQTGFYATGKKWYTEELDPDMIVFGKKTQISGILTSGKYSEALQEIYDLISITHDADLADLARFKIVSDYIDQIDLVDFSDSFLLLKNDKFKDVRGVGWLWAIEFHDKLSCLEFCDFLFKNGIVVNRTGETVVRMRPSFVFTEDDWGFLENVIKDYCNS